MGGDSQDGAGFEEAFERLFLIAYRVGYRILGHVEDAEDVAEETLARTFVAWRRVGGQAHEEAWVVRVATNRAIDVVRRARRTGAAAPFVPVPAPVADPVDPAEAATLRAALAAALAGLSRRQRQVVALRYLAGLTESQVATSLGISPNSVKKHARRGVVSLRERLGADWQEVNLALD